MDDDARATFGNQLSRFSFSSPSSAGRLRSSRSIPTSPLASTPPAASPSRRSSPIKRKSPYFQRSASPDLQVKGESDVEEEDLVLESPTKRKKKKGARPYADPSVYAHLDPLSDYVRGGLDVLMVGINPGIKSAELGQHYASPTNHYYKCLHGSGFTERRLTPAEGHLLPEEYGVGNTNLVPRPSAEASELSKEEMRACVPALIQKIVTLRPLLVNFVGMGICEIFLSFLRRLPRAATEPKRQTAAPKIKCGLQPFTLSFPAKEGSSEREVLAFYAVPSTSARVVAYQVDDKIEIWKDLKSKTDQLKTTPLLPLALPKGTVEYTIESVLLFIDTAAVKTEDSSTE